MSAQLGPAITPLVNPAITPLVNREESWRTDSSVNALLFHNQPDSRRDRRKLILLGKGQRSGNLAMFHLEVHKDTHMKEQAYLVM